MTWDELVEQLRRSLTVNNNRWATFKDYRDAVDRVRTLLPETTGPLDVSPHFAQRFKDIYITQPYRHGPKGKLRMRTHTSFNSNLRKLRSIWGKWLARVFKVAASNPWLTVDYAEANKALPRVPTEDTVTAFFDWLETKYPGWRLPVVFVLTKAVTGCRLMDLCALPSGGVQPPYVVFPEDKQKARAERRVKLPPELAAELDKLKGPVFVWQHYPEQLREHLRRRLPRNKIRPEFYAETLYWFILQLFKDFKKETPHKLSSHDFRKRAVTQLHRLGVGVDTAARALGMTSQNARLSYLALDGLNTDHVFDRADLMPTVPSVQQSDEVCNIPPVSPEFPNLRPRLPKP
jgi:integrase